MRSRSCCPSKAVLVLTFIEMVSTHIAALASKAAAGALDQLEVPFDAR